MLHVSTLLPYRAGDAQQIDRKRHLGNDVVLVVFKDAHSPSPAERIAPAAFQSHFNRTRTECFSAARARFFSLCFCRCVCCCHAVPGQVQVSAQLCVCMLGTDTCGVRCVQDQRGIEGGGAAAPAQAAAQWPRLQAVPQALPSYQTYAHHTPLFSLSVIECTYVYSDQRGDTRDGQPRLLPCAQSHSQRFVSTSAASYFSAH